MSRRKGLSPEEIEYIRQNCLSSTDEEMAKHLNRDIRTISSARNKLGIKKGRGGRVHAVDKDEKIKVNTTAILASQKLNEEQRKEFFKTQLANSLYYDNLKLQLTEDELNFYLEEWGSLCLQFEDIVATEKRQIDEYIKQEIMGNRIMRNVKIAEEEIENITQEIEEWRNNHPSMENDDEAQERDVQLMNLLRTMHSQSSAMSTEYQKIVESKNKLLNELNARRRDRIDQISRKGTTFLSLVQELRDKNTRETQGRHMELVRLAKEKKKNDWRKVVTYPDGSRDCVLMDEGSEADEIQTIRITDKSIFCESYAAQTNKRILIVEDDSKRLQLFADMFNKNNIDFASNADKAIEKLKDQQYDLICLDYDLGLDDKGHRVADYIVKNHVCPQAHILVHSMNSQGRQDMFRILNGRNVEVCPFNDLIKTFGVNENA